MSGATDQLSAAELAVCSATGLDASVFLAAKATPPARALTMLERVVCDATDCDPVEFAAATAEGGAVAASAQIPESKPDGWWLGTRSYTEC